MASNLSKSMLGIVGYLASFLLAVNMLTGKQNLVSVLGGTDSLGVTIAALMVFASALIGVLLVTDDYFKFL